MTDTDQVPDLNPLLSTLDRFAGLSIWVVGDHLGDEAVTQVIDGAFHSCCQRLSGMTLAAEMINPLLSVTEYEFRHQ